MKRFLPLLIIIAVAVTTVGSGFWLYRAKMRSTPVATVTTGEEKKSEARHVRGPAEAPVTLEIYGDFQCPPCANASALIDDLQKEQGAHLRVIYREFPLAMHAHAMQAALAAEAAGMQGRFWEMHDMLYQNQEVWAKAVVANRIFETYAQALGLDVKKFQADSQSSDANTLVRAEADAGKARGVRNTPTIFINGIQTRAFTRESLEGEIAAAFATKGKS